MTKLLLLLTLTLSALGQTPTTLLPNMISVCTEGSTISKVPVGTVYQYGAGGKFTASATESPTAAGLALVISNTTFGSDPSPNVVKSFWVQQATTPYTVTCAPPGGTATVVNVPALTITPPATPSSTTITLTPDGKCTQAGSFASGTFTLILGVAK